MTRPNGVTLSKRRCSEFRQLYNALKLEMPKAYFPELPPKKSTGCNLPLQEKRDFLQSFLDCLLAQKLYNKEMHKFMAQEHEVPVYHKKISKRATKKGKIHIPAAPSSSIVIQGKDVENVSIKDIVAEDVGINMDTLQQRYTTKYESYLNNSSSINFNSSIQNSSSIRDSSASASSPNSSTKDRYSVRTTEPATRQSEINLQELKTGLLDAMTFMARITDIKYQANKFVIYCCVLN